MILTLISTITWLGFIELLALGLLPFWCMLLSSSAEKVLGYSRVLSLLSLTWITWICAQYGGAYFSVPLIALISLLLLITGYITLRIKFNSWRVFLYDQKLSRAYLSYTIALMLLIAFRACSPEIFWGEKPLEFSLFNYLSRENLLPAEHPWAAGSSMSYYYMGYFSLAILQKISALDTSIGFNLGIAFVGASLLAAFEALFLNLRLSHLASILGAILLTLGSNLNVVYLALIEGKEATFDLFWLTTRNFTSPAFAEYPIWSLLFADLHAHVMAMPLVVCLLGITWAAAYQKTSRNSHRIGLCILCGLVWGLLYSVNGWDFISAAILLAIMFGFSTEISLTWSWVKLQLSYIILLALSAAATVLPFRLAQENMFAAFWGWVTTPEYNKIFHIWLHQGVALNIILLSSIGLFLFRKRSFLHSWLPEKSLMIFSLLPIAIGIFSAIDSKSGQPWHILILSVLISAVALLFFSTDRTSKRLRFSCLLVIAGSTLISISESFYLIDRMNTIFKGYQLLWPAFGVAACVVLSDFCAAINSKYNRNTSNIKIASGHILHGLCFSVIAVSLLGTIINLSIMLPMKRTSNNRFSLYGTSYLDNDNKDEAFLIRWLQKNVPGKAYIAEASGDAYQAFTRVTMHTGLPSLLGWEHHSRQGGVAQRDINQRKAAIQDIFAIDNIEKAYAQLQFYGIDFVFIGKLELEKYPARGTRKFAEHPELFIPIAWKGDYTLYLTNFSPLKRLLVGGTQAPALEK